LRLLIEVVGIFFDCYGVGWAGCDTAHAAYTFLHVGYLYSVSRIFVDSPRADAYAGLAVCAFPVVDCDLVQPSCLSLGDCADAYKNTALHLCIS
jgi:hypothetical protein